MKTPKIQGDYRSQPINQGPGQGVFEDRVIAKGGQSPLGNMLARNVGGGGPGAGRDVYGSGAQMIHGEVNPGLAEPKPSPSTDTYYYDKE